MTSVNIPGPGPLLEVVGVVMARGVRVDKNDVGFCELKSLKVKKFLGRGTVGNRMEILPQIKTLKNFPLVMGNQGGNFFKEMASPKKVGVLV